MSALRKQVLNSIGLIPDNKLKILLPILEHLQEDDFVIETNLTKEEKDIIIKGRKEYTKASFVPLEDYLSTEN